MSDTQNNSNDRRPLLPNRNFGLAPWSTFRWTFFGRQYDTVPNSVDVESSSASHNSTFDVDPRPGPSGLTRNDEPTDESLSSSAVQGDIYGEVEFSDVTDPLPVSARTPVSTSVATLPSTLSYASVSKSSSCGSSSEKICLICLEPLPTEEFESGHAIRLDCQCKGDAALRHRACAQKWVDIKGDLTCDVCRTPIANLNPPQPRSDAGSQQPSDDPTDASRGRYPSATDVFDCIRMTWVVTIVCILFFRVNILTALITGLLIAILYTWSCQLMRCAQFQVGQNEANGLPAPEIADHAQQNERHENVAMQAVPAIVIV